MRGTRKHAAYRNLTTAIFVAGLVVVAVMLPDNSLLADEHPVLSDPVDGVTTSNSDELISSDNMQVPEEGKTLEINADPCRQYDAEYDSWLDRNQVRVYRTVCGTAAWLDGFFGESRYQPETGETYGRIGAGTFWDERDGWDNDLRLRARFALPALRNRGAILVGRGDEQELIEERATSEQDGQPAARTLDQDDSLYVGFGFRGLQSGDRGLDYSVGVKVRSSPELYAKTTYRQEWQTSTRSLLKIRPIIYWRSEEGFGSTLNVELDYLINQSMLYRWGNFANVSEDEEVEGVSWGSSMSLYQVLSKRRALTYSIFVSGETKADVELQNYGFEFRYRQRILREWLFIEYLGSISWPREFLTERRETNLGAGIRLEAYFGPAPESWVR